MSEERTGFVGFVCFVAGAAIGAGLALLFAPQSGEETRKKIKDFSGKMADEVKEGYEKISKEAKKSIDQVKNTAENAIDSMKSFVDGVKDKMKKEIKAELKEEEPQGAKKKA